MDLTWFADTEDDAQPHAARGDGNDRGALVGAGIKDVTTTAARSECGLDRVVPRGQVREAMIVSGLWGDFLTGLIAQDDVGNGSLDVHPSVVARSLYGSHLDRPGLLCRPFGS